MIPIRIVIHMTGLLLLTPENQNQTSLTHVLMPKPYFFMPEHVAELGYREADPEQCKRPDWYDEDGKICYRNMQGYSMWIGRPTANTDRPVPLPRDQRRARLGGDIPDLSVATNHYVRRDLFARKPANRLRSRITLSGGHRRESCALYTWEFNSTMTEIANVVTWVIEDAADNQVVLTRRRFGSNQDEALKTLAPDGDSVELFIRQVPPSERAEDYDSRFTLSAERGHVTRDPVARRATHFQAYYRLLYVPWLRKRPIPSSPRRTETPWCHWSTAPDGRMAVVERRGVGTAACMVAGGSPAGP